MRREDEGATTYIFRTVWDEFAQLIKFAEWVLFGVISLIYFIFSIVNADVDFLYSLVAFCLTLGGIILGSLSYFLLKKATKNGKRLFLKVRLGMLISKLEVLLLTSATILALVAYYLTPTTISWLDDGYMTIAYVFGILNITLFFYELWHTSWMKNNLSRYTIIEGNQGFETPKKQTSVPLTRRIGKHKERSDAKVIEVDDDIIDQ